MAGNREDSMANSGTGDIFDVRKIRRLVELMNDHDLNEIDLRQKDQRIRLRRGQEPIIAAGPVPAAPMAAPAPPVSGAAAPAVSAAKADEGNFVFIKSEMVGTFYSSPNPESAAFVKVGD